MVLLPEASSVMTISATLMGLAVLLFSAREETVLARVSALGALLSVSRTASGTAAWPSLKANLRVTAASCSSLLPMGAVALIEVPEVVIQAGPSSFTSWSGLPSGSLAREPRSRLSSTPGCRLSVITGVPSWGAAFTVIPRPCSSWRTVDQLPVGARPSSNNSSRPSSKSRIPSVPSGDGLELSIRKTSLSPSTWPTTSGRPKLMALARRSPPIAVSPAARSRNRSVPIPPASRLPPRLSVLSSSSLPAPASTVAPMPTTTLSASGEPCTRTSASCTPSRGTLA